MHIYYCYCHWYWSKFIFSVTYIILCNYLIDESAIRGQNRYHAFVMDSHPATDLPYRLLQLYNVTFGLCVMFYIHYSYN